MELTIEISCCKFPPRSQPLREWENNIDGLLSFVEQAHLGIKGEVRKEVLGKGQLMVSGAKILVQKVNSCVNFNKPGFPKNRIDDSVVTTNKDGLYWKLLLPGQYWVRAIHKEVYSEGEKSNISFSITASNSSCIKIEDGSKIQKAMRLDFIMMPYHTGYKSPTEQLNGDISGRFTFSFVFKLVFRFCYNTRYS